MSEQNSKIAEMLDHLVNDDTAKAEELFHEYVVAKSRDIYEGLIEDEVDEATKDEDESVEEASEEDKDDEAVDEASDNDDDDAVEESADNDDEEVEEGFDEVELEGDDMPDATDAFTDDAEEGDEEEGDMEGGDEPATKDDVMDLKDAIDELENAFKEYADGEDKGMEDPEMDDMEAIQQPEFESEEGAEDLETVREYVEKVDGHGAEKKGKAETADNKASPVAKPNNMGGTTANMTKGGEGGGSETGLTGKAKDMNTKNINKVGGSKDGERMSNNGAGHGAEKSGAGENSADATSIIGSK
jgi:hypothetical protein